MERGNDVQGKKGQEREGEGCCKREKKEREGRGSVIDAEGEEMKETGREKDARNEKMEGRRNDLRKGQKLEGKEWK